MILFVIALAILTAIQFLGLFEVAGVAAVIVALSVGVTHIVFRLTGARLVK